MQKKSDRMRIACVDGSTQDQKPVALRDALRVWLKISLLSFGGPAGQIAVMHRLLVDELKWVSERRFVDALNFCMLLPGPEAQQLTIYLGWLLHRIRGGIMAGIIFVLPGALSVLGLSIIYVHYQQAMVVGAIFYGVKAGVLAIVVTAVWRLGKRLLRRGQMLFIAFMSFLSSFMFGLPFPLVIVGAALAGWLFAGRVDEIEDVSVNIADRAMDRMALAVQRPSCWRSIKVLSICATIWLGPVIGVFILLEPTHILAQQGVFFSQVAVVTFGGAYAVLSYVAQQTVGHYGWLAPGEMLDGLGMAEATPGPLILVTQFVGFLGAYRNPGTLDPMLAGVMGACITTWVTFAPCFLWIFLGAPYIESLRSNRALASALSGITAAVVGVLLNLTIWFGLQVLFVQMADMSGSDALVNVTTFQLPVLFGFDVVAAIITLSSLAAIGLLKASVITVIVTSSAAGLITYFAGSSLSMFSS